MMVQYASLPRCNLNSEEDLLNKLGLSGSYVEEQLLAKVPSDERVSALKNVMDLKERRLCIGGFSLPTIELLGKIAKIPTIAMRERLTEVIINLCHTGVPGADETMVLDFLSYLSLEDLDPIVKIAKAIVFNFNPGQLRDKESRFTRVDHCIEGLEIISRIKNARDLQLVNLEGCVSTYLEIQDPKKRAICRLLSLDTPETIHASFDMAGSEVELFEWIKKVIKNVPHLKMSFFDWKTKNPEVLLYNQSIKTLKEMQAIDVSDSKLLRLIYKNALNCFLEFEFQSKKVNSATFGVIHPCTFILNRNAYTIDEYSYLNHPHYIIKNAKQMVRIPAHFINKKIFYEDELFYREDFWTF